MPNARAVSTTFAAPAIFTRAVYAPTVAIWNRTRQESGRPRLDTIPRPSRLAESRTRSNARLAPDMRVAIVHYWLLGMRGGEKVVEALCRLYPDADLFTLFFQPDNVSPLIRSHRVTASFLNAGRRFYRSLLPLMPLALEQFDLREYDLVISSESGPAKGVLTRS